MEGSKTIHPHLTLVPFSTLWAKKGENRLQIGREERFRITCLGCPSSERSHPKFSTILEIHHLGLNQDYRGVEKHSILFSLSALGGWNWGFRRKTDGFVWQGHDLWQLWGLSLSSFPSWETPNFRGIEASKLGRDRIPHCYGATLSLSSSFPPLPLSPKQNRSELSQGNKNVLFLADGTESRLGNKINLLFLSLPLL